ncbi:DUF1493 family protein [Raoultella ornithinolytica]|uniref:DUF1493 family protein n=1 Tax=Raoultella ornithinolytica TaxID=54291 RepID=UPI000C289C31|nr:DUF1493 family protein [Raoultella ornithinolytica]EKW7681619.1 DUF1493 family protein [Raoultella ornithinolytica]ELN4411344.1 DUF1493 family protein [Raoultella ornithinolytica]ELT0849900.1 DUF1493 family protein [Raoultella ornithinolytica]PJR07116.1 cytoplasmic protein [Raoultella ornithinolytica]PQH30254.1 DUF1493 domain-containing protein [Raoultella ornithinolytica]
MVTDNEVLEFFQKELPVLGTLTGKLIPLEMDDVLQEYAEDDDLVFCMNKYSEKFDVDISAMNYGYYYPWFNTWFFRKWFTRKPVKQVSKPLTVRMFAESAKAGRWLYD